MNITMLKHIPWQQASEELIVEYSLALGKADCISVWMRGILQCPPVRMTAYSAPVASVSPQLSPEALREDVS